MTRLESGAIAPNRELVDLTDIVGSALTRASKILSSHRVELDIARDLPMLRLDPVLFEQVLFNLLDNAAKYAPADSTIRIRGWRDDNLIRIAIMDEGAGIRPLTWSEFLTNFTGFTPQTENLRALDLVLRSAAVLWKQWAARSWLATAPTERALCSPSVFRSLRRTPRSRMKRHERQFRASAHPHRR